MPEWTADEDIELARMVAAGRRPAEIARELDKPFVEVIAEATRTGLRGAPQPLSLPRGAGYDKLATRRHMRALERYDGSASRYAKANGLNIELLVRAMRQHLPERWEAYMRSQDDLPERECAY